MSPTREPEPLIDIDAVAARLGVQPRHVRRLVHERRIPFVKWGHLVRFDPAEIERWVEAARRPERRSEADDVSLAASGEQHDGEEGRR